MYVLLPALFFFARKSNAVWPLLLFWILAAAFCRATFSSPNEVNLATVIPMFLPGVMAFVAFHRRKPVLPAWTFVVFLALIIACAMRKPTNREAWYFNLAIGLVLPFFHQLRVRWLVNASHQIAKYSYGIYLTHPFGLVIGIYLLRGHGLVTQLSVELLFIAIASIAAYHLLEKPMIDVGTRVAAFAERRYEKLHDLV